MTFGATVTDHDLSRMAPIEQELAKAFAAELGHTRPAEKPQSTGEAATAIDLGLSDLGGMIRLDLEKILDGRLLVQGTSGAGKSWTLRRILEQTHGLVQQIVIDPEGEFVSLARHFDYGTSANIDTISTSTDGASHLIELQLDDGTAFTILVSES
jgi:hypothetical protein